MWGWGCGDREEGVGGGGRNRDQREEVGWGIGGSWPVRGQRRDQGKEEVRPMPLGCLVLDPGDTWGPLQEAVRGRGSRLGGRQ